MRRNLFFLTVFLFSNVLFAQVGIGADVPASELDIKGSATGAPTLKLTPQAVPTGTATGQLAVINDILYQFDLGRNSWLSVESTMLTFGLLGPANDEDLEYIGDVEDGGPIVPFNASVVYATANTSGGELNKLLFIDVYAPGNPNPIISAPIQFSDGTISNPTLNVPFPAGVYAKVRVTRSSSVTGVNNGTSPPTYTFGPDTGPIIDPLFSLWLKWRIDNP